MEKEVNYGARVSYVPIPQKVSRKLGLGLGLGIILVILSMVVGVYQSKTRS
jgi:hypothetical protein